MDKFFGRLASLVIIMAACIAAHQTLPSGRPSTGTIANTNPDATAATKALAAVGLAVAEVEITDGYLIKVAKVRVPGGNKEFIFLATPLTPGKWVRL